MVDASFDDFLVGRRADAAAAYVNGDAGPLEQLLVTSGSASFHSPRGDTVQGATEVGDRYRSDAGSFAPGSTSRFEIIQSGADGDIGFWTGFQIATVNLAGQDEPVDMRIRVTEVFRRVDGEWKLAHRHADAAGSDR